jgi:hypothetical protein
MLMMETVNFAVCCKHSLRKTSRLIFLLANLFEEWTEPIGGIDVAISDGNSDSESDADENDSSGQGLDQQLEAVRLDGLEEPFGPGQGGDSCDEEELGEHPDPRPNTGSRPYHPLLNGWSNSFFHLSLN